MYLFILTGDIIQLSPFVPNVPAWLRDGNDSTCNSNPAFKKLSINFDRGLPFYWFRLSVNNSGMFMQSSFLNFYFILLYSSTVFVIVGF